jgi:pSer/pThr/pTyr-binding forkhead associated (FHA) protein
MPILQLQFKDKVIYKYPIEENQSLSIGRREGNDIVIENVAVSGQHAKVDSVEGGYIVTDLQSTNGTFVNEKMITSHSLKHGDKITIGKHTLVFGYAKDEKRPAKSQAWVDETMVLDTDAHRMMLEKTANDLNRKMAGGRGFLSYINGGDGELELTKKLTKIGKDYGNEVVTSGLTVGKVASTISKRPQGYFLNHAGGLAKTRVNGKPVKESVMLKDFDTIEIGSVKVQFIIR